MRASISPRALTIVAPPPKPATSAARSSARPTKSGGTCHGPRGTQARTDYDCAATDLSRSEHRQPQALTAGNSPPLDRPTPPFGVTPQDHASTLLVTKRPPAGAATVLRRAACFMGG